MKPWKRATTALAACLASLGATIVFAPAAQAGTASISKSIYLAASSTGRALLPGAAAPRSIYLAEDTYRWNHFVGGAGTWRDVSLPAGWYNWGCYLDGTGAAYPSMNYRGNCLLDAQSTNHPDQWLAVNSTTGWTVTAGTWTWSSSLTQL